MPAQLLHAWRLQELLRYHRQHGVMSGAVAGPTTGYFIPLTVRRRPYPDQKARAER